MSNSVWKGKQSRHTRRFLNHNTYRYELRAAGMRSYHRTFFGAWLMSRLRLWQGVKSYYLEIRKGER